MDTIPIKGTPHMTGIAQTKSKGGPSVLLFRVAGLGAFSSAAVLIAVIFSQFITLDNQLAEILIFVAPLLLIPVVPALHSLHRSFAPRLSFAAALIGMAGILPIVLALFLRVVFQLLGVFELSAQSTNTVFVSFAGFTSLIGVWICLASILSYVSRQLPAAISFSGVLAGATWMIVMGGAVLNSLQPSTYMALTVLLSVNLLLWIASHLVWTTALGIWLLTRR